MSRRTKDATGIQKTKSKSQLVAELEVAEKKNRVQETSLWRGLQSNALTPAPVPDRAEPADALLPDKACPGRTLRASMANKRKRAPAAKAATRARKATPTAIEANRAAKEARRVEVHRSSVHTAPAVCRGYRDAAALGSGGTWRAAASETAIAEDNLDSAQQILPPSFAQLNDLPSLDMIGEMYTLLGQGSCWTTCVVCWRAWFAVDLGMHFRRPGVAGSAPRVNDPWFSLRQSTVLTRWGFESSNRDCAHAFLEAHYPANEVAELRRSLIDCVVCGHDCTAADACSFRRNIAICKDCGPCVHGTELLSTPGSLRRCDMVVDPVSRDDAQISTTARERWQENMPEVLAEDDPNAVSIRVLGQPLATIAPPLADLTDFEEMVISLVHPLVQVFTIPTTGELAYVGHICNFRQHVSEFLSSLPVLPKNMPFVLVRPRRAPGQQHQKRMAPHRVDVPRLRRAFDWLKRHNPYYREVVWDEESAAAWDDPDAQLPEREEELPIDILFSSQEFRAWMDAAALVADIGENGYLIGRRLRDVLMTEDRVSQTK